MTKTKSEHEIQNAIRLALGQRGIVLRLNVGKMPTLDGRYLTTGLPPGTCDLLFVGEGHAVFIECKTSSGRLSQAQQDFIAAINRNGAPHVTAGVSRSVEDALALVGEPHT